MFPLKNRFVFSLCVLTCVSVKAQDFGNIAIIRPDTSFWEPAHAMDLQHSVLRFTSVGQQFRMEKPDWNWDDQGIRSNTLAGGSGTLISLQGWSFPFSGQRWDQLYLNSTGSVTFGAAENVADLPRFFTYRDIAAQRAKLGPVIAPMWRLFKTGTASYSVRHRSSGVTITFEFQESPTEPNRFSDMPRQMVVQILLEESGQIEFRYEQCSFVDGAVLVAPALLDSPQPKLLQRRTFAAKPGLDSYLDFQETSIEQINSLQLRFTMVLRDVVPAPRPKLLYWFFLDTGESPTDTPFDWTPWNCSINVSQKNETEWIARYCGGEEPVTVKGQTISFLIPREALGSALHIRYGVVTQDNARTSVYKNAGDFSLNLGDGSNYAHNVDFASGKGGLLTTPIWESFHYRWISPDNSSITKQFYAKYRDNADFLVLFTAFPFDATETGGTNSGVTNTIDGISLGSFDYSSQYGSSGKLQSVINPIMLPVPFHAKQGVDAFGTWNDHERSMWLIAHEVCHRWGMRLTYNDGTVTRALGDSVGHWLDGLSVPSAFPVLSELETSPMGGYRWRANDDGSFTALTAGYAIPSAYSWLDLYAMGLAMPDEVGMIDLIDNFEWNGNRDGFRLAKGNVKHISMSQVIDSAGKRLPSAGESNTVFNTAFVLIGDPGDISPDLLVRLEQIRQRWIDHFGKATGGRGVMNAELLEKATKP